MKSPAVASSRATTAALDRLVDRGRVVAALAGCRRPARARSGVGSSASTPRTSSTAARQVREPVSHSGMEEEARGQLRVEVRALLRHRLAARGRPRRPARRSAGAAGTPPRPRRRRPPPAPRPRRACTAPRRRSGRRAPRRARPAAPWMKPDPAPRVDLGDRAAAVRLLVERRERARRSAAIRCVGKIVRPSCSVGTITASIQALASVPSSSWKASAVS